MADRNKRYNETQMEQLLKLVIEGVNEVIPMKTKVITNKWKLKPWFNKYIKQLMKERDNLFFEAKSNRCGESWVKYQSIKNKVVAEIRNSKKIYYEQQIDGNKRDSKKMWRNIKELIGNQKNNEAQGNIVFKNVKYDDPKIIAEKFNEYIENSVKKIVG